MIYIYTENFFLKARLKNFVKFLLGKNRGPEAVFESLKRGLKECGQDFTVNDPKPAFGSIISVLSGTEVLKWAIVKKQTGLLKKIIAGPNMVVMPEDARGILKSPQIDRILTPSLWVKECYIKQAPELLGKIDVWASGVEAFELKNQPKIYDFLVYKKNISEDWFSQIKNQLLKNKMTFQILSYGQHTREEYLKLLSESRFMVYLSETESQGIAMLEAWMSDVPVLVLERGYFEKDGIKVLGNTASPYLDESAGLRFKTPDEFGRILTDLSKKNFQPRAYALENFTDKLVAENFLKIFYA